MIHNVRDEIKWITLSFTLLSDFACLACEEKALTLNNLSSDLQTVHNTAEDLKKKLSAANISLATTMDKENKLRGNHETLILEEAQGGNHISLKLNFAYFSPFSPLFVTKNT